MRLFCVKVSGGNASKAHAFLLSKGLFEKGFAVVREKGSVFFPCKKPGSKERVFLEKEFGALVVKKNFRQQSRPKRSLKEALAGKLSQKELGALVSSFDSLGDIAIIEVPPGLEKKEKLIANALLEMNRNIKTVCKKTDAHSGEFRVEPVKILAGKRSLTATYRESGCVFRVSLGKVFFSPRLSTERQRISHQIKEGEVVGALFAGVGPFPIVFAKNSPMKLAFAVELNPAAVNDLLENISKNRVEKKVEAIFGDVRKVVPQKLAGLCDRVVMPLPKGAEHFLGEAILCLKPTGGIIHFYDFVPKDKMFSGSLQKIRAAVKLGGKKFRVLSKKKVRDFSPSTVQVVIDFKVI